MNSKDKDLSTDSLGNPKHDPEMADISPKEVFSMFISDTPANMEVFGNIPDMMDPSQLPTPSVHGKRTYTKEFGNNQTAKSNPTKKYKRSNERAHAESSMDESQSDDDDEDDEDRGSESDTDHTRRSSVESNSVSGTRGRRRKKQPLTEEEQLNVKEKNREHARNTRIRKKYYVESLKETIKGLNEERDRIYMERKILYNKMTEQTNVRKKVLQDTLNYRVSGSFDLTLWSTLFDESIVLLLPVTPYRSFSPSEIFSGQRVLRGIPAIMQDAASLQVLLQSIAPPVVNNPMKVRKKFHDYLI
jgi:hypothetical protein